MKQAQIILNNSCLGAPFETKQAAYEWLEKHDKAVVISGYFFIDERYSVEYVDIT